MDKHRRGFLSQLSIGVLAVAGAPRLLRSMPAAPSEPWLEGLHGKHKQFFDVAANTAGGPLERAAGFLDAYRDAYGLEDTDVNVIFGAHSAGLAFVLGDGLWLRYKLGAHYTIDDPSTKSPSVRNVFSGATSPGVGTVSVTALQTRGVRFLACMRSINKLSRVLSARTGESETAVHDAILAGLLPGVTAVPAMIVATNRAQESGLTYAFLG